MGQPLRCRRAEHDATAAETSLCWLVNDTLHEFAELPSGGGATPIRAWWNSLPAAPWSPTIPATSRDAAGRQITAIYLAELAIEE